MQQQKILFFLYKEFQENQINFFYERSSVNFQRLRHFAKVKLKSYTNLPFILQNLFIQKKLQMKKNRKNKFQLTIIKFLIQKTKFKFYMYKSFNQSQVNKTSRDLKFIVIFLLFLNKMQKNTHQIKKNYFYLKPKTKIYRLTHFSRPQINYEILFSSLYQLLFKIKSYIFSLQKIIFRIYLIKKQINQLNQNSNLKNKINKQIRKRQKQLNLHFQYQFLNQNKIQQTFFGNSYQKIKIDYTL
ncbi:hypothetical protein TTHERM_001443851 (macronuclear) [Tetrahymena thermophila SB210]|uniref:Uncharacterized protein n=1 Tax=Tetrahymena thermophila (strain SB210) TaxID=312017 RepID=W7X662_TETTS|nr:hypothetical protein TTHERM_001443851 [Tetrahymena thermophila SB210]EWS72892.1 hypothetical protein TTHERM_001443851 [Tetrahymena thermophila SB210]|eukprot:XP_012654573.1 hypothetical protein TTHERM_001443851 [Tetrahymena thermophila SB210]